MIIQRGNFPKSDQPETPLQRRLRYEAWVISTHAEALEQVEKQRQDFCLKNGASYSTSDSRQTGHFDPEFDAIMLQPGRKANASRPSAKASVRAACWRCVQPSLPGNVKTGEVRAAIRNCPDLECSLRSIRPYQPTDAKPTRTIKINIHPLNDGINRLDHAAKATAYPGNLALAVRGYCFQCQGGQPKRKTTYAIWACENSSCPMWLVRPIKHASATPSNHDLTGG